MNERTREVSRNVTYSNQDGKIVKKTIIYEIVGNAKWIEDDNYNDPNLDFKNTILNVDDEKSKQGYVVK